MTTFPSQQGHSDPETKPGHAFKEHSAALKDDVRALKGDAAEAAGEAVHSARESVQAQAERMAAMAQAGGQRAQELHETLRHNIARHPTASVLTALGVGIVLGRLLGGR